VSGLFTGAWIARPLHWANTFSKCGTHLQQYAVSVEAVSRLPFRYLKHISKLICKLDNSDLALQHNEVISLNLALASIDGIVTAPGEYFSLLPPGGPTHPSTRLCRRDGAVIGVKRAAASVAGSAN
jgi:vancomycin resistance protein YoaR